MFHKTLGARSRHEKLTEGVRTDDHVVLLSVGDERI